MKSYLHICFTVFLQIVNLINYVVDLKPLEMNFLCILKLTTATHLPQVFSCGFKKSIFSTVLPALSHYGSLVLS